MRNRISIVLRFLQRKAAVATASVQRVLRRAAIAALTLGRAAWIRVSAAAKAADRAVRRLFAAVRDALTHACVTAVHAITALIRRVLTALRGLAHAAADLLRRAWARTLSFARQILLRSLDIAARTRRRVALFAERIRLLSRSVRLAVARDAHVARDWTASRLRSLRIRSVLLTEKTRARLRFTIARLRAYGADGDSTIRRLLNQLSLCLSRLLRRLPARLRQRPNREADCRHSPRLP